MSFIDNLTAKLPFLSKTPELEYFFALDIGLEKLIAAVWTVDGAKLKILNVVGGKYLGEEDLINTTDRLLDQALGSSTADPKKILFGVPDSWLQDEDLKEEYLKLLRKVVKDLEITPMAYVSTTHAITHYLEKQDGAAPTATLIGIGDNNVIVSVIKAGKIEGTKSIVREHNIGSDIEKGLLALNDIEVLPSKMLVYGLQKESIEKYKNELLSFPWMTKLSFLHLPRIEIMESSIIIKAVTLAGGVEINPNVKIDASADELLNSSPTRLIPMEGKHNDRLSHRNGEAEENKVEADVINGDLGFVAGDVMDSGQETKKTTETEETKEETAVGDSFDYNTGSGQVGLKEDTSTPVDFYDEGDEEFITPQSNTNKQSYSSETDSGGKLKKLKAVPLGILKPLMFGKGVGLGIIVAIALIVAGYIFIPKAKVVVYIEPRILERDAQVVADPNIKQIDEANKQIPGQSVETDVSGSETGQATGTKKVGDPAKGVAIIYNKADSSKTLAKGTVLSNSNGLKFTLDSNITVASQSAVEGGISFGKGKIEVTASAIGPDGNLPSGSDLSVSGFSSTQVSAKAEGNFSGGTSKEVTVVTDADQKRLLASLTTNLRKKAQEELQGKLTDKKIIEEAFSENIVKKTYSKNINDQANDFTLNLTIKFKGTAFAETDLKTIVSKLVETNVPDNFVLDIANSETRADVSKVEPDGKVLFLARFRAKLIPKIDTVSIRKQLRGKTPDQAASILKSYENVLGSDIHLTPPLPSFLQRLPFLESNIKVEVSQK